jgi:hypothetical protein
MKLFWGMLFLQVKARPLLVRLLWVLVSLIMFLALLLIKFAPQDLKPFLLELKLFKLEMLGV